MNKRKKVAWHKHLKKEQKLRAKGKLTKRPAVSTASGTAPARPRPPRPAGPRTGEARPAGAPPTGGA